MARGAFGGIVAAVLLGLFGCKAAPLAAPESTDLYLVSYGAAGSLVHVGDARNLTRRDGWDNQPAFLADGNGVLYSSIRGNRSDIWRYDISENRAVQLTDVEKRLYLAQPTPDGAGFSVVRRERDDRQRIWRFAADGSDPQLVFPDLSLPVLYYTWIDERAIALSVEEDDGRSTLHVGDVQTGELELVAEGVGRSIQRVPGRRAFSFVEHESPADWWISMLDLDIGLVVRLTRAVQGSEDHAWLPTGEILSARGSELYLWAPGDAAGWRAIAEVEGVRSLSRIAVSPGGDWIVLVGAD